MKCCILWSQIAQVFIDHSRITWVDVNQSAIVPWNLRLNTKQRKSFSWTAILKQSNPVICLRCGRNFLDLCFIQNEIRGRKSRFSVNVDWLLGKSQFINPRPCSLWVSIGNIEAPHVQLFSRISFLWIQFIKSVQNIPTVVLPFRFFATFKLFTIIQDIEVGTFIFLGSDTIIVNVGISLSIKSCSFVGKTDIWICSQLNCLCSEMNVAILDMSISTKGFYISPLPAWKSDYSLKITPGK